MGDLRVRAAGCHQRDDLALAVREGGTIETLAKWTRNRDVPQRDRSHRSGQHRLPLAVEHQGVRAGSQQVSRLTSSGSRHDDHDSRIRCSAPCCLDDDPCAPRAGLHDEDDVGAGGESLDGSRPGAEVLDLRPSAPAAPGPQAPRPPRTRPRRLRQSRARRGRVARQSHLAMPHSPCREIRGASCPAYPYALFSRSGRPKRAPSMRRAVWRYSGWRGSIPSRSASGRLRGARGDDRC